MESICSCGSNNVRHIEKSEVYDTNITCLLRYKVCNTCGSEFADSDDLQFNKGQFMNFENIENNID